MARLARPSTAQQIQAERSQSTTSILHRRRVVTDSDDEDDPLPTGNEVSSRHTLTDSDSSESTSDSDSNTDSDSDGDSMATVLGTRSSLNGSTRTSSNQLLPPASHTQPSLQAPKTSAATPISQGQVPKVSQSSQPPQPPRASHTSTRKPLGADDISSMLSGLSISRSTQNARNGQNTQNTQNSQHTQNTQPKPSFFDRIAEKKLNREKTLQNVPTKKLNESRPKHTYFPDDNEPKFGQTTSIKNKNNQKAAGLRRPGPESKPIPKMQFAPKPFVPKTFKDTKSASMNAFQASAMSLAEKDMFAPMDPTSSQWGMRINMDTLKKQAAETTRPVNDISFIKNSQWGTRSGIGALSNLESSQSISQAGNEYGYVSAEKTMESLHELFDTFDNKNSKEDSDLAFSDGKVEGLHVTLLPHQIRGLRFLLARESPKLSNKGGLLCDDMGLGKTIQSISLILSNPQVDESSEENAPIKATLVVAPLALVHQWGNEIREKSPGLRVMIHHGPKRDKTNKYFSTFDVIVTTFQVVASEYANNGPLFQQVWWRIIVDEAHTIKNHKAKSTLAAYGLRSNRRWCLTGTPIQNSIDELQSLIGFLEIGPFNNRAKWTEQISRQIGAGKGNLALNRLHVVLGAIMLRRTKVVLGESGNFKMPARNVHRRNITLSDSERSFYTNLEKRVSVALQDMQKNYLGALLLLLRLRQACNHMSLANGEIASDIKDQDSFTEVQEETDDLADILQGLSINETETKKASRAIDPSTSSSKITELIKLLEKDSQRKTIVFSQFTSMLNLIEPVFKSRGVKYTRYDGSMTSQKREQSLETLRNDPKCTVLLCSLKCGALGLNLTCASQVVLIDPWWNPMISEQAIDRVHRLGQTRDVDVYELIVLESVEERIMLLQDKKRELAKAVVEKGGKFVASNKLTKEELFSIFRE